MRSRPAETYSNSSVTWAASSRVGTSTSAAGLRSAGSTRWTIGIANASVLPEPGRALREDVTAAKRLGDDERLNLERRVDAARRKRVAYGLGHPE